MTTMRSVEPPAGIDAVLERLFPLLAGTTPEPGERGIDSAGNIYRWAEPGGWVLTEPIPQLQAEAG